MSNKKQLQLPGDFKTNAEWFQVIPENFVKQYKLKLCEGDEHYWVRYNQAVMSLPIANIWDVHEDDYGLTIRFKEATLTLYRVTDYLILNVF